jgi:predicted TIM-barrel fold metal-dependent hydrolase
MRLDIHTHCDNTDKDKTTTFVAICEELETRAVICSAGPRCDHVFPSNDEVLALAKPYREWLLPFAFVDLWDSPLDGNIVEEFLSQGFRGLKCITPYFAYDHDYYLPVYEAAERLGLPVLFHTGLFRPGKADPVTRRPVVANMRPLTLDRIARSFPNLKIVAAHMGTTLFRQEAAQLAMLHPNLYCDLAGNGSWMAMQPEELSRLLSVSTQIIDANFTGFRKLLLGSDAYISHPHLLRESQQWYERTLQRIGLSQDLLDQIMGGTASSWLI